MYIDGEDAFGNYFSFDIPKPWNVCKSRNGKEEVLLFTYAVLSTDSEKE